jgi:hypothetical protein
MRLVGGRGFTFDTHQSPLSTYSSPHVPLVSLLQKGLVELNLAFVPDPPFSSYVLGSHTNTGFLGASLTQAN